MKQDETQKRFKSFAVMSIVADLIHNFTDGLSIGVSFAVEFKMGIVTALAMFAHEIPHTFGDFAILLQLEWSISRIVTAQLLTALAGLAGSLFGAFVGQLYLSEALSFTSGGFLYFGVNGLLSEMKESTVPLSFTFASFAAGLYTMYAFALFE